MEKFLSLPQAERQLYFEEAARQKGLSAQVIEKDFWVCWLLKQLFVQSKFRKHLIFKGGTSLSKCYHIIERFSEDIDLSLGRKALGITPEQEPSEAMSDSQIENRIKKIYRKARVVFQDAFLPDLNAIITAELASIGEWTLDLGEAKKDLHVIYFRYPQSIENKARISYLRPEVKIELSARAEHQPIESKTVAPYLIESLKGTIEDASVTLNVLAAERTFWEKATILHAEYHRPSDGKSKNSPPRLARHCYDLYQLHNSEIGKRALDNLFLLETVARHKSIFYPQIWAHYESAKPGTLRLYPNADRLKEYRDDYRLMADYFFNEPPDFTDILECLRRIEDTVNRENRA